MCVCVCVCVCVWHGFVFDLVSVGGETSFSFHFCDLHDTFVFCLFVCLFVCLFLFCFRVVVVVVVLFFSCLLLIRFPG